MTINFFGENKRESGGVVTASSIFLLSKKSTVTKIFTTILRLFYPFYDSISLLLELKISSQWCDLRCHFCGPLCICRCESFSLSVWVSMVARDENEGMCYCYDTPCARNRLKSKPKKRQKHKQIHYPRKKKIIYE